MPQINLTVTYQAFKDATTRGKLHTRSTQMKAASRALRTWEGDKSSVNETAMVGAWYLWHRDKPREFQTRDELSRGLCSKLRIEMGFEDAYRDRIVNAVELQGNLRVNPTRRQPPKATVLDMSMIGRMGDLAFRGIPTAVMLIDVQTQSVERDASNRKYDNENSVLSCMQEILQLAGALSMPVIEVITGNSENTVKSLRSDLPSGTITVRKATTNVFEDRQVDMVGRLAKLGVSHVIVMGYNANMCVGTAIFGTATTPYIPGMVDHGYTVVTSRTILLSDGASLQSGEGWPYMGPANN